MRTSGTPSLGCVGINSAEGIFPISNILTFLGKEAEARANTSCFTGYNQHTPKELLHQSDVEAPKRYGIAPVIAKEHGISESKVIKAKGFSQGVDIAETISPGIKDDILSGKINVPKSAVSSIRNIPEDQRPGGCNQSNAYDRNETDKNR